MAGNPKKRAARIAQQAAQAGTIPEALSEGESGYQRAGARAPAPAPTRETRAPLPRHRFEANSHMKVGPSVRGVADSTAADEMQALARVLRPGVQVRIERIKPAWCAGWIEDLSLDTGSVGELLEQLREEWGGAAYRCTVLQPNGLPAFELRIPIAGPPRSEGKRIDRDTWTGERSVNPAPVAPQVIHAPATDLGGILGVFQMIMDTNARATDAQMAAMRELSERSAAQNQGLIEAMLQTRQAEARGGSLSGQLTELMEANRAIERVKRNFGAASGDTAPTEDEGPIQGAVKEAAKDFFKHVIASEFVKSPMGGVGRRPTAPAQRPQPQTQQPAPAPTPIRPRAVQSVSQRRPNPSEIPEAV